MKRYFAGQSAHGTSTSHGFANDWDVYVFNSKRARDEFVENSENITTIPVLAKNATDRAANWSLTDNCQYKPEPFSGEYWGIVPSLENIPGCIGELTVCFTDDSYERFYK